MVRFHRAFAMSVATLVAVGHLTAQAPINYIYDELGRLVSVIAPNGEAAIYTYDSVGNLLSIARQGAGAVSVIQFTPRSGPVDATIKLYGTGYSTTPAQNAVSFNGTAATVTAATAHTLTVVVPSGATTGTIAVTSPSGSATSTSAFTVTTSGAPGITGFTPSIGVAGTSVTVTGVNFDTVLANNRLQFNQSLASLSSAAAASLVATVPPSTGSGRIALATVAGDTVSTADFFIPPAPYAAADVDYTNRFAYGESRTVAIGTSGRIGLVVFDGTAGQRASVKIVPGPSGTTSLYKPDGALLSSRAVGILTALLEPSVLARTGTYAISVDPTSTGTGSTTITVYNVPADVTGTITPGGGTVPVSLSTPGQNARLTFTGAASQRISLSVSSGPSGAVSIRKPDNSVLASTSIGIFASFINTQTLASAGTYAVVANPNEANTGTVSLTLYDVPADVTGSITPGGSDVIVPLSTPGQNGRLTFSGTTGQRISLKIGSGPSGSVTISNPDDSTLASAFSGIVPGFIDTRTLGSTGTHAIGVDPSGANTGNLTLTLYDVPADTTGTVTIGGAGTPVTLNTPGLNGSVTFGGTAQQQVTVHVTANSIPGVTVKLLKPDGSQLTSATSSLGSFDLSQQTLPVTGTYTIVVDPTSFRTGSLTVSVTSP